MFQGPRAVYGSDSGSMNEELLYDGLGDDFEYDEDNITIFNVARVGSRGASNDGNQPFTAKSRQRAPKGGPRGCQDGPREAGSNPEPGQERPEGRHDRPSGAPTVSQDGPGEAQERPRTTQESPKRGPSKQHKTEQLRRHLSPIQRAVKRSVEIALVKTT